MLPPPGCSSADAPCCLQRGNVHHPVNPPAKRPVPRSVRNRPRAEGVIIPPFQRAFYLHLPRHAEASGEPSTNTFQPKGFLLWALPPTAGCRRAPGTGTAAPTPPARCRQGHSAGTEGSRSTDEQELSVHGSAHLVQNEPTPAQPRCEEPAPARRSSGARAGVFLKAVPDLGAAFGLTRAVLGTPTSPPAPPAPGQEHGDRAEPTPLLPRQKAAGSGSSSSAFEHNLGLQPSCQIPVFLQGQTHQPTLLLQNSPFLMCLY